MWGQGSDPGGTESENPTSSSQSNQELNDLKDQYEQQQVLIAQLKEMIRKTEQTTVTEEKLEEYANTLTRMSARAKLSSKNKGTDADKVDSTTIDTPAKEKILFLRQQMEENKLKLAERKKFHKGIEDTVTQLKAQLDDSQHQIHTPLNLSLNETKVENYNTTTSTEELISLLVAKDKRLIDQNLKIQKLEANVLDLQENVKEKDSVIDARTKAITLMTESLSKKGKNTLDALDDTKEQMRKMQENFVALEMEMKREKQEALDELDSKCLEVNCLKDEILLLQNKCQDQQVEIVDLKKENESIVGLSNRIKELDKIIEEFESKSTDSSMKSSPQRSSKRGRKGQKMQKSKSKESIDEVDASIEMKKLTDKISKYESTITELNFTIEEIKNKPEVSKAEDIAEHKIDNEEIAKLKKQLEESNKNMIKMKAQNKSKIKELNKVIDQLKSADTSKLNEEITALNEQISLLQQQNPKIESEFESSAKEQLELTISKLSEEISIKSQKIVDLEQQLEATKELSNLKSAQVESEITSIHFEEQVDQLEIEKKHILQENEVLLQEKCELLEKLESMSKEKQELMNKLDNYMQENMDLIDKLEKLSAEKVSSAESIEIVESFTQQEKLELEAYQKSLDMDQSIKTSSENLADNQELNESVNQLTEETSDLLRKIELFTEERREVMDKMEALTLENNHLTAKIHEIENNRDILSETYEQLQNEKEELENKLIQQNKRVNELEELISQRRGLDEENVKHEHEEKEVRHKSAEEHDIEAYKNLIEIQKMEIRDLKLQLLSQKDLPIINEELRNEISSLQDQYEILLEKNQKLNSIVKENSEKVHEKDSLETELKEAHNRIKELDEKLLNNIEEIENYRSILNENKEELIGSATKIDKLQCELLESKKEVTDLNSVVQQLEQTVSHLENNQIKEKDDNLELMTDQLQELKVLLTENIKQIQIYENELTQNSETISILNEQLGELNKKLLDMEHDLESKDFEINELIQIRDKKEKQIENLQSELKHKEDNFHKICNDLKEKCLFLQQKIEQNTDSLDNIKNPSLKLEELEIKNKEQLEKMKKIAANLKRKTIAYQELEAKLKENHEKHELEVSEKVQLQETLKIKDEKIASLLEQLDELEKTYLNVQNSLTQQTLQFNECNEKLTYFTMENEQLHNSIENQELQLSNFTSMKEMHHSNECNILNFEINEKNLIINTLQEQLESSKNSSEITSNALNVKIKELEMFIENQEAELGKYKDRIAKLEEGLSNIEDRRQFLEQQNFKLDEQLREKSSSFEEISHTEDILEQRIFSLMEQDDKIQRTLKETNLENRQLFEYNRVLIEENNQLKIKLEEISERNIDVANVQKELSALRMENEELSIRLNDEIDRCLHFKGDYERKQEEIELMEGELQGELERLDDERKTLSIQCEHLREQLGVYGDNRQILEEEIEMYKSKVEQQQNDFERKLEDYEKLNKEHKINQNHIEELTSKISNLEELLANKDNEVSSSKQLQIINDNLVQSGDNNEGIKLVQEEPEHKTEATLSNFVWPDSSASNFFDLVPNQPQENTASIETPIEPKHEDLLGTDKPSEGFTENDKQELLKKIKTLEFMLYNIEQEKNDVLLQCQSLTNEISRLIYERQNPFESQICSEADSVLTSKDCRQLKEVEFVSTRNQTEQEDLITPTSTYLCYNPDALKQIEPQICSSHDTNLTSTDLKGLQNIEFEKTTTSEDTEYVCVPKTAYLCYELEENLPMATEPKAVNVEPQILPVEDTNLTQEDLKQLHAVEFVKTKSVSKQSDVKLEPVVEDKFKLKLAYLCQDSEESLPTNVTSQSGANLDIFDENDDGWGCGMDEVILEENHRQRMDNISRNKNLTLHVEALEEKVQVLEVERQRHIEEIKQAQIKSGKLIKKLKEFKSLNDKLNSDLRKSDEFGGLNDAIVDELKLQVVQLEKKIKENVSELEKEKNEKSNLLKKVDTLQVSSDRLIELKDKQEVEILSCQRQNKELIEKLQQFEWGNESFDSPVHTKIETTQNVGSSADENEKKILDLTNTIKELSLDNEDLQLMLEEQRNLRITAEKSKSVEPILENMKTESEYMCIVHEKNALSSEKEYLNGQLELLTKDNEILHKKAESLNSSNVLLEQQLFEMKGALINMEANLKDALEGSRNEFSQLTENYNACNEKLLSLENTHKHEMEQRENDFDQLKREKIDLENTLYKINSEIETQTNSSDALNMKIKNLEEQLTQIEILQIQNDELNEKLKLKDGEIEDVRKQLQEAILERSTLTASIEQLEDEWNHRVDQRGADVAESWKLHLEMREKEFLITEQQFRKEINDLEEKCNAIVNENNELRKNVDAEIRNEVDRVSALQQQIFDRDHHINELKLMLQEMKVNLESQNQKVVEYENIFSANDTKVAELVAQVRSLELEITENVGIITTQKENLQNFENLQQRLQESQFAITNLQLDVEDKAKLIVDYLEKLDSANKESEENRKRLENKDSCIANLQQNLQDVQKQTDNVNNYNISMLNQQIHDLNVQLEDKQTQFESLNFKFNENLQVKDAEVNKLRNEIDNLTLLLKDKENLKLQIEELQLHNNQLTECIEFKDEDIKQLKTQINQLELLLIEREKEYTQSLTLTSQENETMLFEKIQEIDIIKRREAQLEINYDELLSAKNADMENLKIQLQYQTEQCDDLVQKLKQQEEEVTFLKNELNVKDRDHEELYNKNLEQNSLLNEENKQLSELRLIIEEQVMKIEDLKQELFEKSKDYDSLIAELDIRKTSRIIEQENVTQDIQQQHSSSMMESGGEIVSQAELDLALYMLHQRDVRCEELTVELMQLLEERDTLQLKLSNAIREKEEMRCKILGSSVQEKSDYEISNEMGTSSSDPTLSKTSHVTNTELATEARESVQGEREGDYLANKLSQLKSVGYGKDKMYLDEQQRRRLQQLSLMQQHRDVASLLPPEAAARLVQDANYTLSRDVQSPSKVLLNWLWGKSTPKVNDI